MVGLVAAAAFNVADDDSPAENGPPPEIGDGCAVDISGPGLGSVDALAASGPDVVLPRARPCASAGSSDMDGMLTIDGDRTLRAACAWPSGHPRRAQPLAVSAARP